MCASKRNHKVFGLAFLLLMFVSCGSPTPTSSPPGFQPTIQPPTPVPLPTATRLNPTVPPTLPPLNTVTILLFNYWIVDRGDGWRVGNADLAVVNTSEQVMQPQTIELQKSWVETQEAKNYDANVFTSWEGPLVHISGRAASELFLGNTVGSFYSARIDPNGLPIPSYLPISMIARLHNFAERRNYFVQFRFAQSAHPTKLRLKSSVGVLSADIPAPIIDGKNIIKLWDELGPAKEISARSLIDLSRDLSRINSKIQVDFGQCTQGTNGFELPYRATNTNQLDEERLAFPYGIWHSNGLYTTSTQKEGAFLSVGPGQTTKGSIRLPGIGSGVPTYLVRYEENRTQVYRLNCPSSK